MAKKNIKSETPKKKRPISLNILEITKRLQKVEEIAGESYTLPTASDSTKGGVKIGSGLTMTGEVLSTDPVNATNVSYSNSDSGLLATDVQGAVDELAESYPATRVMLSDGTTSVEDALDGLTEDSGWKTTGDISYRKIGNFVTVHGEKNIGTTTQAWVVLGNLPEGYRPSFNIKNSAYTSNATAGIYIINKNGDVSVWGNSANIDMHLCLTFPLG